MALKIKDLKRGGREKIKLYHYGKNGKYLKEFDSHDNLRKEYFKNDIGKRPLTNSKRWSKFRYDILPDGTFYSNYRIGKQNLLRNEKIVNSKFCFNKSVNNIKIKVYNLLNQKIAIVENSYIAELLTGVDASAIESSCKNINNKPKGELYFKYEN